MALRIISAAVFAAITLLALYFGTVTTFVFTAFLTIISAIEITDVLRNAGFHTSRYPSLIFAVGYLPVALIIGQQYVFSFMVLIIMITMGVSVVGKTHHMDDMVSSILPFLYPLNFYAFLGIVLMLPKSAWMTLFVSGVAIACFNDAGAYFIGVNFGKTKLSPQISPKKTVEGAIGGVVFGVLCGAGLFYVQSGWGAAYPLWFFLLIGFVGAIAGQVGDLVASAIKRRCNVKDFGKIVPGHGGVLDRLDSIIFCLPAIYFIFSSLNLG